MILNPVQNGKNGKMFVLQSKRDTVFEEVVINSGENGKRFTIISSSVDTTKQMKF